MPNHTKTAPAENGQAHPTGSPGTPAEVDTGSAATLVWPGRTPTGHGGGAPESTVRGPVAAAWREGTLTRAQELDSLCSWMISASNSVVSRGCRLARDSLRIQRTSGEKLRDSVVGSPTYPPLVVDVSAEPLGRLDGGGATEAAEISGTSVRSISSASSSAVALRSPSASRSSVLESQVRLSRLTPLSQYPS
jgi:hypothetical protein